jgi:hypothetical protein
MTADRQLTGQISQHFHLFWLHNMFDRSHFQVQVSTAMVLRMFF